MRRIRPFLPPLLALVLFTIAHVIAARAQPVVTMVDYWYHLDVARGLALARPETWLHPFYPVGYFLLLRAGLAAGADVVAWGQAWSWLGAVAALSAVYAILYAATRRATVALAGLALLALHPFFRFQALQEGTDMLAAGLQLAAVAVAFATGAADWRAGRRGRVLDFAAGALLGAAYLVRYTALTLLPVLAVTLVWREWRDRRAAAVALGLLLGGFGLLALPQLVAGTVGAGNPLYNEQARNVWFGIYGDFNWTDNWGDVPAGVSVLDAVRADPAAFARHWAGEFGRVLAYDGRAYADDPLALERKVTLWEPLLAHLVMLASAVLLLFDQRLPHPQKALLLLALLVPILATSMAWLFTRYLLVALGLQVAFIVLALTQLAGRLIRDERSAGAAGVALVVGFALLFLLSTNWGVKAGRAATITGRILDAQPLLAAVGIDSPTALMTNNRLYQNTARPERTPYLLFRSPGDPPAATADFLRAIIGPYAPDFLLFDWTSHAIRTIPIRERRAELEAARDLLAPLVMTDEYMLACVLPCRADEATPVGAAVSPTLTLDSYRTLAGSGGPHGLYLYWRLSQPAADATPLSLTLRDATGTVVYEYNGHAQGNTYPLNRWPIDQPVVDFHPVPAAAVTPGQTYYLSINLAGAPLPPPVPISFLQQLSLK